MCIIILVKVYVELVIFNNLAVDFLLIVCVQIVRRRRVAFWRTLIACVIGSAIATVYAVSPKWAQIVIKIFLAPFVTVIFDNYKPKETSVKCAIKDYVKSLLLFCSFTYFLGGITIGVSYLLGVDINSYALFGVILLALAGVIIVARCIVHKRAKGNARICDVVLRIGGEQIKFKGLCDSGNLLTDTLTGLPVVILSNEAQRKLPSCNVEGYICVDTVGEQSQMPIIRLDRVIVKGKQYDVYGALSHKDFNDIDVILQCSMF